jgi:O-antigen/teichoic acid export membrane protein
MSLQRNILVNFASQIYVALIGIVMLPMYVTYMGAEAYGLVGFFAMLQAWFNLLDIGLTPTIARETARHRGGATDALSYRSLVRAMEVIFLTIAAAGALAMLMASAYIARDWLRVEQLPPSEVVAAVQLMAFAIATRWMAGFYRGAINGSERQVWLGAFNAGIATLRFCGVLPLLIFVGTSPTLFFRYQLGVASIELGVLMFYAYRLLPKLPAGARLYWSWKPLKPVMRFSLTIAFTSLVWVFVTQTDKLVLSRILPLADYGYFTLAVLVSTGIMVISGPVGNAVMPRLARLEAEGAHTQLIRVYRQATQLVAIVTGAFSITVALSAEALLWAWTGDRELAHKAAPILTLYALGNGILSVCAFPYYLQFAKGNLRLHLIGNAVFVVLLIPLLIWSTTKFGGVGAGYVWLGMNLLSFVAWLPFVHRKFEPGLNLRWYVNDIATIVAATALTGYVASLVLPPTGSRMQQFAEVAFVGLTALAAGAAASSAVHARIKTFRHAP